MKRDEMEYCPFCGSQELETSEKPTPGPETYYDCPNCGVVGTTGVGYLPTRVEQ